MSTAPGIWKGRPEGDVPKCNVGTELTSEPGGARP